MNTLKKTYKFYDTDILGLEEHDIVGIEYKNLIEVCCKYCTTFSVIATNKNSVLLKKLQKYETKKNPKISFEFEHYTKECLEIKYYNVTSELYKTLIENTNNIFCWINGWNFANPEDPTFYREDGSVFLHRPYTKANARSSLKMKTFPKS